mgnify:CR=1 FL=1
MIKNFSINLASWYEKNGRLGLPWHKTGPYRVWISEIMLQQTQVSVCIPYFERFIKKFPDLVSLADSPLDSILTVWAGLGYYSRARNLHAAARMIMIEHNGKMPKKLDLLMTLPGIGQTTAGAILALGHRKFGVILDANVKRVISRLHRIDGDLSKNSISRNLWNIATVYTPKSGESSAIHCQAIMDFGSLLCTRNKPKCSICPFCYSCKAFLHNEQEKLPRRRVRQKKREEKWFALEIRRDDNYVLLIKRPTQGIWGGLYSLPIASSIIEAAKLVGLDLDGLPHPEKKASFNHKFSHFSVVINHLQIKVYSAELPNLNDETIWYHPRLSGIGIPTPILRVLKKKG